MYPKYIARFFMFPRRELFIVLILVGFSAPVFAETMIDFFKRECADGKQESCVRLEEAEQNKAFSDRLDKQALEFSQTVNRLALEEDNKPNLYEAYAIALQFYLKSETENGIEGLALDEPRLPRCADHYHNHWRNKKLWWPVDDEGKPDWAGIYIYIIDHYYGFCMKYKFDA